MSNQEIVAKIKEVIARVASIDPEAIGGDTSYEELSLDSLTLLEIGVDIDYEFQLDLPDEELRALTSVNETARLVERYQEKRALTSEVA